MEHIKISNVLDHGNLINKICKITIDEDIEYVIMATKGVTSLTETFLGTATTKVMNDSKAVVYAITEKFKYEQITKILFLIKCNYEGIKVLKKVIEFAKIFDAHIDCLPVKLLHKKIIMMLLGKSFRKLSRTKILPSISLAIIILRDRKSVV